MRTLDAIAHFREPTDKTGAEAICRLSDALGISRQAVYQWGEEVPELRALQLERMTHGRLQVETAA